MRTTSNRIYYNKVQYSNIHPDIRRVKLSISKTNLNGVRKVWYRFIRAV
jgi:hypothetical protein